MSVTRGTGQIRGGNRLTLDQDSNLDPLVPRLGAPLKVVASTYLHAARVPAGRLIIPINQRPPLQVGGTISLFEAGAEKNH
jgi:hypothetical protein